MSEINPLLPQFWTKLLWSYFEGDIKSGQPIYFGLDSRNLENIAQPHIPDISRENASNYFHYACCTLMDLSGKNASILPTAYKKTYKDFSAVICLAIQQVLIVEDMIDDQYMSYDSYFPRYRHRLKLDKEQHSNPLSKDDFENLWKRFKHEILSIDGSSEKTVTFKPGIGRKNATRNYPLSQALFSTRDLHSLRNIFIEQKNIDSHSNLKAFHRFFYNNRYALTSHGRRVIQNEILIRNAVEQFRYFITTIDSSYIHEQPSNNKNSLISNLPGSFIIGKKIQGFRERYTIRYKIDFDNQHHENECLPFLDHYIQQSSAYVFFESPNGFISSIGDDKLQEHDTFLLCYRKDNETAIGHFLSNQISQDWCHTCKPIALLNESNYTFRKCDSMPASWQTVTTHNGKILSKDNKTINKLGLNGGLCINKRENIYLDGYPPQTITFNNRILPPSEAVVVNGVETTIGKFLKSLRKRWQYKIFHLDYQSCTKEFLLSSSANNLDFDYIGFQIYENELYPIAQPLSSKLRGLCGWKSLNDNHSNRIPIKLSDIEITWLARPEDKTWIHVDDSHLAEFINEISSSTIHDDLKELIKFKILQSKKLPAALISRKFPAYKSQTKT